MFCCSSCVSNVKEDDLIKGRLLNLDTVSLRPAVAFGWFLRYPMRCRLMLSPMILHRQRRMLCSEGGRGRNHSTKAWWTPKLWNSQLPFCSMFFFSCCNILWNLVKIKHYMRLWDTIWKSYQLSVWSCDVAFTTRPEKATNHTSVRKLVNDRGPQLHIIGVNKKSQSPVLGHFTGVITPIISGRNPLCTFVSYFLIHMSSSWQTWSRLTGVNARMEDETVTVRSRWIDAWAVKNKNPGLLGCWCYIISHEVRIPIKQPRCHGMPLGSFQAVYEKLSSSS